MTHGGKHAIGAIPVFDWPEARHFPQRTLARFLGRRYSIIVALGLAIRFYLEHLKLLLASKGEPVSRHTILGDIWSSDVTTRTVDTHIWNLREKLEEDPSDPKHIVTVHRIGYKFME